MIKLRVQNLSKSYSGTDGVPVKALENISLDVRESEFLSILGPSGCGKSTLLRILDGLIPWDQGKIERDGKPITGPGQDRGFVFQSFNLFPWRSVTQNIEFGLVVKRVSRARRKEISSRLVELVGLRGFENSYPHELSGGMQQRVGIARALAIDPEILLMDEPFGSLDAQTREDMQDELLRIWSSEKKTVVFVTHSIEEAIYLSDRVIVISPRPGKVVQVVEVPFDRPRKPEHKGLVEFTDLRQKIYATLKANK